MVVADRNNEPFPTNKPSSSRTLNTNSSHNSSSTHGSSSSEMNSDSDNEQSVRVGNEFQAEIPDYCLSKPAPTEYPDKAMMIWTPNNSVDEDKMKDFLSIATEKYNYNCEQALGVLFWHSFNMECALADLPNFVPFPDEWTMEDKALFEQAYQFYNKNFHKINQLLPDKKISSLVKFYYTWKKVKSKSSSYIDKQVKKSSAHTKDDSTTDSATNDALADSDTEYEGNHGSAHPSHERKECANCLNRSSSQFYNTKLGLLCRACFSTKRKDGSLKVANSNHSENHQMHMNRDLDSSKMDMFRFPKSLTPLLLDQNVLNEIAQEREVSSKSKVLEALDSEIEEANRNIRNLKQANADKKTQINELPDFPLLNQNNNRIISRWSESEILLLTHAVREFGRDFKTIAEIIGNKTESQIKNYFLQNYEKMNLAGVLNEYNEENDFEEEKVDLDEAEDCKAGKSAK